MAQGDHEILEADYELGYTYTRTVGPILGRFLAALKEGRLFGIRGGDGRVLFPPVEYDPITAEALDDFEPVEPVGEVVAWTWIPEPRPHHGVDRPFAFALIRLDGADTPFLSRLFCDDPSAIRAGTRVRLQWSEERRGAITDIHGFVPEA